MTNIKDLTAEQKARVEKALASAEAKVAAAEANPTAADVKAMVDTPAAKPATVVPNKKAAPKPAAKAPAKPKPVEVDKDIVDSISVITVPLPAVGKKTVEAEIVDGPAPYTKAKAEALDKRIVATVTGIGDSFEKLEKLVGEAKEGQIHIALGFASWTAYFAARVNTKFAEITDRQVAALMLHEEGMSNRAIAATLGVSPATVVTDVKEAKAKRPAASTPAPATPKKTVGKDGKEYTRTAAKKPAAQPKPAPKPEPKPTPKLSQLEIRTDLALADAENLVADIESLIETLGTLYGTPEFVAGGDKEIKAEIAKARKLLGQLPAAPTRRTAAAKGK